MIINPYLVQPSVPAFTGLLDTYTGAAVAYSAARRLATAYTGSLIRVRRSSDNAEQDIGYDGSNVLDESALTTFVGAGNGFVTTWYDQSGNSKNAIQTTAILQPKIVSSGSVILKNSKPNINFTAQRFNIASTNISSTSLFSFVGNSSTSTSYSAGFISYQSSPIDAPELRFGMGGNGNTNNHYWNGGYLSITGTTSYVLNKIHTVTFAAGITFTYYGNNTSSATGTRAGTWNTGSSNFSIGGYSAQGLTKDGDMQEFILYNSDQSANRTGINTNINTFYSIF